MAKELGCPYCGLPLPTVGQTGRVNEIDRRGVPDLLAELARIRRCGELLEADAGRRRIEELEREVRRLRETVARLRGGTRPLLAE